MKMPDPKTTVVTPSVKTTIGTPPQQPPAHPPLPLGHPLAQGQKNANASRYVEDHGDAA
jgi:hypothetical protein